MQGIYVYSHLGYVLKGCIEFVLTLVELGNILSLDDYVWLSRPIVIL